VDEPALISPEALQQDFRVLQDAMSATHPDPGIYVSAEKLKNTYSKISAQLQEPLTRDQAWRVLAQLNPIFSDAHLLVWQPDWAAQAKAHLAGGGALFPFEVQVSGAGEMWIRAGLGGSTSSRAGSRIEQINGIPASRILRELLPLVSGDTPELRAHLLSRRMWFYYWKVFGAPKRFDLVLGKPGARILSVAGSTAKPHAVVDHDEPKFEKLFRFEILGKNAALLTIDEFGWSDKPAFYAFTRVLDRPSGERRPALLQPDIVLPDSPFDHRAMVNALLRRIAGSEPKRSM
jgi:hypothetical protein